MCLEMGRRALKMHLEGVEGVSVRCLWREAIPKPDGGGEEGMKVGISAGLREVEPVNLTTSRPAGSLNDSLWCVDVQ